MALSMSNGSGSTCGLCQSPVASGTIVDAGIAVAEHDRIDHRLAVDRVLERFAELGIEKLGVDRLVFELKMKSSKRGSATADHHVRVDSA